MLDEERYVVLYPCASKPGQAPLHRGAQPGLRKALTDVLEARDDRAHLMLTWRFRTLVLDHGTSVRYSTPAPDERVPHVSPSDTNAAR